MAAPADSESAVEQAALGPKRVTIDGETVEQYTIDELIKAANFADGQTAKTKPAFGLRFTKLVPPGAG